MERFLRRFLRESESEGEPRDECVALAGDEGVEERIDDDD